MIMKMESIVRIYQDFYNMTIKSVAGIRVRTEISHTDPCDDLLRKNANKFLFLNLPSSSLLLSHNQP